MTALQQIFDILFAPVYSIYTIIDEYTSEVLTGHMFFEIVIGITIIGIICKVIFGSKG